MNERIRELALQVDLMRYPSDGINIRIEKFAEVIVRECAKVVDDIADPEDSERYFWAIQNASQKIIQHFGIEE